MITYICEECRAARKKMDKDATTPTKTYLLETERLSIHVILKPAWKPFTCKCDRCIGEIIRREFGHITEREEVLCNQSTTQGEQNNHG
jgi:hypothetical protein